MTDWCEPFLAAIREDPADDGVRLTYADYLEERGECDLASFIRVQCELANREKEYANSPFTCGFCNAASKRKYVNQGCSGCQLRSRERALLEAHAFEWIPSEVFKNGRYVGSYNSDTNTVDFGDFAKFTYRRGFVAVVRCPSSVVLGRACERCQGRGSFVARAAGVRPSGRITCPDCNGNKHLPGIAAALGRLPGLERVELADKRPLPPQPPMVRTYRWFDATVMAELGEEDEDPESDIPSEIFKLLRADRFDSASAANDALAIATAQWCRQQAAEAAEKEGVTV